MKFSHEVKESCILALLKLQIQCEITDRCKWLKTEAAVAIFNMPSSLTILNNYC